jgi:hypothetical protein
MKGVLMKEDKELQENLNIDNLSQELIEAIQEGEDILSGKQDAKSYTNMYELLEDLKS